MSWNELVTTALLGSEKQAATLPAPGTPLGDALAGLDLADREGTLLGAAAAYALYQQAGQQPPTAPHALPAACPPEERPCPPPRAARHLAMLLDGHYVNLLPEWLQLVQQHGMRVPAEHLPALLDAGRKRNDVARELLPVLGRRGQWLAHWKAEWNYAQDMSTWDVEQVWHTGRQEQRKMLFAWLREYNPARARDLLAATWKEEGVKERTSFLYDLSTNLGPDDETFLETALDDRGKDVRREAANLLARLPDSALVQRMIARVRPLLRFEQGSLTVTLPENCTKEMQRDGVELDSAEKKSDKQHEGQEGFFQMLGKVPPSVLQEMLAATPEEITRVALRHEWREDFLTSLRSAIFTHREQTWARALLQAIEEVGITAFNWTNALLFPLIVLPLEERESWTLHFVHAYPWPEKPKTKHPGWFLLTTIMYDRWNPPLSRAALDMLRHQFTSISHIRDYHELCRIIDQSFAYRFAPELLEEAAQGWDEQAKGWKHIQKAVQDMLEVLHFRRAMREAFTE